MKNFKFLAIILITGFLIGCPRGGLLGFYYSLYLDGPVGEKVTVHFTENKGRHPEFKERKTMIIELPGALRIAFGIHMDKFEEFSEKNPVVVEVSNESIVEGVLMVGDSILEDYTDSTINATIIKNFKSDAKYKDIYKTTTKTNKIMEFKYKDAENAYDWREDL